MDSKNGNGKGIIWITFWIFAVIVFPTLFFIGNNVIANEKASRERDAEISDCIYQHIIPMKEDLAQIKTALGLKKR